MALVAVTAQLKAKLMAKGQHRPNNMIRRKLPDGADMLDNLPKRASGAHSDDEGANDEYCAAIDKVTNVFGAQKRAQTGGQPRRANGGEDGVGHADEACQAVHEHERQCCQWWWSWLDGARMHLEFL